MLFISILFINSGINEYKDFIKNEESFIQYEQEKVKQYVNYTQYGGYGFRVLYEPAPPIVFFGPDKLSKKIESNIDTKELINVLNIYKGRALFDAGRRKDFAGIIYLIGSLYMLLMGLTGFKSDELSRCLVTRKNIFLSLLSRSVLLTLNFILIFMISFSFAGMRGISFSPQEIHAFIYWSIQAIVFLIFFYLLGLLIFGVFKSNKILVSLIVWFAFIIVIPEIYKTDLSNHSKIIPQHESLNTKKLKTVMDAEREMRDAVISSDNPDRDEVMKPLVMKYLEEGYRKNLKMEKEFNATVLKVIELNEKQSLFFPTIFYEVVSDELSSRGYSRYSSFMDHITNLRDRFMKYYIKKRYIERDQQVKPFITPGENIFKAESKIPANFWKGIGMTGIYCLLILGITTAVRLRKSNGKIPETERLEFDPQELEPGEFYFVLCKDEAYRERLFTQLSSHHGVVGLDRIKARDIDPELPPRYLVPYLCQMKGLKDKEKVDDILETLGIKDFQYFQYRERYQVKDDDLKKIYAGIKLAEAREKETILINDFLVGESKTFERNFITMLESYRQKKKRIIYLSTEMYLYIESADQDEILENHEFEIYNVDLENVSLR